MGRKLREQARGVAFHITGRTLDHWFQGKVAASAEQILLEGIATSDALLLAHIVMPNHFHLVVQATSSKMVRFPAAGPIRRGCFRRNG